MLAKICSMLWVDTVKAIGLTIGEVKTRLSRKRNDRIVNVSLICFLIVMVICDIVV